MKKTHRTSIDCIPDVRDGLTRQQRIVLTCLYQLQQERQGRSVPSVMLYGRVVELLDIAPAEFEQMLSELVDPEA